MNTTIIKADQDTRLKVLDVVTRNLNRPMRPVCTFLYSEDTMVISGCPTSVFLSYISQRLYKKIVVIKFSK